MIPEKERRGKNKRGQRYRPCCFVISETLVFIKDLQEE